MWGQDRAALLAAAREGEGRGRGLWKLATAMLSGSSVGDTTARHCFDVYAPNWRYHLLGKLIGNCPDLRNWQN